MTTPQPGSLWRERRPSNVDQEWLVGNRRVVEVDAAEAHGFVEGVGRWQEVLPDGSWQDHSWGKRKTRVRTNLFLQRYELVEDGVR